MSNHRDSLAEMIMLNFASKLTPCNVVFSATEDSEFKPEAGRYHMYVALGCPWAHRTQIMRKLKGLEDAISVDVVDWVLSPDGWKFNDEVSGAT